MGNIFGFYGILTDPVKGYDYLCRLLVDYEVKYIQLRMKKETMREVYKTAELLRKITDGTSSKLIINDYVQVALDVYADGVHLGQDDDSPDTVIGRLRNGMELGLSTHNPDQTKKACEHKPAYIGVGPVFKTPTKDIPDPVLGLSGMKEMLDISTVPAVAIGAIDESNLRDVLQNGAANFASVRPINQTEKPEVALKRLLAIWKDR